MALDQWPKHSKQLQAPANPSKSTVFAEQLRYSMIFLDILQPKEITWP